MEFVSQIFAARTDRFDGHLYAWQFTRDIFAVVRPPLFLNNEFPTFHRFIIPARLTRAASRAER